jgi:hypothetical protein
MLAMLSMLAMPAMLVTCHACLARHVCHACHACQLPYLSCCQTLFDAASLFYVIAFFMPFSSRVT